MLKTIIERDDLHRADVTSGAELNMNIRAIITGLNERCHSFGRTRTEIIKKTNRPNTSEVTHKARSRRRNVLAIYTPPLDSPHHVGVEVSYEPQ